jgi:glutamate formiminotransferase / 5-formyltetrahydrofolate cyclo-ligase
VTGTDNAPATTLLAVPNVSEGRDDNAILHVAEAFSRSTPETRLLDIHRDPDHHRSVFTLAGAPGTLAHAVLDGAREAVARIDLREHQGAHPRIGAIDVAPIVYLRPEDQGAACAEALVVGDLLGDELELPVFLYGALADGRTRAELRRGGPTELSDRIKAGELKPDFGPDQLHPTAGAALVAARPPLVAFNVELAPGVTLEEAQQVAAAIREGGSEGLPSLRALGLWLTRRGVAQVSMNLDDHTATTLAAIVEAISNHAAPSRAEVVGLIPESALHGFPENLPLDCAGTVEQALAAAPKTAPESDPDND